MNNSRNENNTFPAKAVQGAIDCRKSWPIAIKHRPRTNHPLDHPETGQYSIYYDNFFFSITIYF